MDLSTMSMEALTSLYGVMPQDAPRQAYEVVEEVPETEGESFKSIFDAAMGLVSETNDLQNAAENEQIKFELGLTDNMHDLMIAEQKASLALQYTIAIRDQFLSSYQQLMQMQI